VEREGKLGTVALFPQSNSSWKNEDLHILWIQALIAKGKITMHSGDTNLAAYASNKNARQSALDEPHFPKNAAGPTKPEKEMNHA
jgi:hypothetical protein